MRPLIGIPTRTLQDQGIPLNAIAIAYTYAIELAGGAPVLIPLRLSEDTLCSIFSRLDGLLLAGGVDVHPREFGEPVEPFCGDIDVHRDAVELNLIRWALEHKMPTLGICRGIQMLNVAAGGTLYQDIPAQLPGKLLHSHRVGDPYNLRTHRITIEPGSTLARALGDMDVPVNSLHHQSLKDIAPGFHIIARASDGIIEGIEADRGNFALGVQFHPEWLVDDDARMVHIFEEFVRAAIGHRPVGTGESHSTK